MAESISLEAGLRMEGIPALGLWDTAIVVLEPIAQRDLMRKQNHRRVEYVDHIPPHAHMSSRRASFRDQDDHERQESQRETRFQDAQS